MDRFFEGFEKQAAGFVDAAQRMGNAVKKGYRAAPATAGAASQAVEKQLVGTSKLVQPLKRMEMRNSMARGLKRQRAGGTVSGS